MDIVSHQPPEHMCCVWQGKAVKNHHTSIKLKQKSDQFRFFFICAGGVGIVLGDDPTHFPANGGSGV